MKQPLAVVVGAAALDTIGFASQSLKMRDSNPGYIRMEAGGVGRNIAENLAWLGIPTELICVIGDDPSSRLVQEKCKRSGLGMSHSIIVPGITLPQYLAITDECGDMVLALSDMKAVSRLVPTELMERHSLLAGASILVADGNLPQITLEYLAREFHPTPFFVDPVSAAKAGKIINILDKIHALKINALEAETLTGIPVHSQDSAARAGRMLIDKGLNSLFITMGSRGVYWNKESREGYHCFARIDPVSATGAGDAFTAGLVYSEFNGIPIEQTIKIATAAAGITLKSPSAVNPEVSRIIEISNPHYHP